MSRSTSSMAHAGLVAALALLMSACASTPPTSAIPAELQPAGEATAFTLAAVGVQVYECRTAQGGKHEWTFVRPEADLFDAQGAPAGRHGAGPFWEAVDGSRITAKVKARADAPRGQAIPWLLLEAKTEGPTGRLSPVTSVQRVATLGGVAPAGGCGAASIGAVARVPYSADYNFLRR